MFNSWGSLSSALSRRAARLKRRDSESSENEERSLTAANENQSVLSTTSSSGRSRVNTVDNATFKHQRLRHGFTPAKIEDVPSRPVDIEGARTRRIKYVSQSSCESLRTGLSSRSFSSGSSHVKLWEQAYAYGCR